MNRIRFYLYGCLFTSLTCYLIAQANFKTKAMVINQNISYGKAKHLFYYNPNSYENEIFDVALISIYVFSCILE